MADAGQSLMDGVMLYEDPDVTQTSVF